MLLLLAGATASAHLGQLRSFCCLPPLSPTLDSFGSWFVLFLRTDPATSGESAMADLSASTASLQTHSQRSAPATFSDLGRRDTLSTAPARPDTPQSLQIMFKSVTSSHFSPPLNTAVTAREKNWLERQRKTLELVKSIKKTQKKLPKKKPAPARRSQAVSRSCPQTSQLTLTQRCPRSQVVRVWLAQGLAAFSPGGAACSVLCCSATGA